MCGCVRSGSLVDVGGLPLCWHDGPVAAVGPYDLCECVTCLFGGGDVSQFVSCFGCVVVFDCGVVVVVTVCGHVMCVGCHVVGAAM